MKIGVLTLVKQSQYGTPIFIILKKEGTVRFITHYFSINEQLVKEPHILSQIGDTIQILERFQYVTVSDLNMRY